MKKSHDDLIETQQKVRTLEIDYKELTSNYNQLNHDQQLFKRSNEQTIESENQRRTQYEKEIKQFQQQLTNSQQKEKQIQEQSNQIQNDNERLIKELRQMNNEYQTIKTKLRNSDELIEGLKDHFDLFSKV